MKKKGHVPETGNDGVRVSPDSPHRVNRWGHLPNQSIDTGSEQSNHNATMCTSAQHRASTQTRAKLPMAMLTTKQHDEHARQHGQQRRCENTVHTTTRTARGRRATMYTGSKHRTHNVCHNHVLTGARLERGTCTQENNTGLQCHEAKQLF